MNSITLPVSHHLVPNFQNSDQDNSRRKGKIARLPKPIRDMINHMLDDGLPYHVIIDELGEAGEGLNAQNLTNWKQGGYQDYLKIQQTIDQIKAQTEAAIDILKETAGLDASKIIEACSQVAAVQLFNALMEHGDSALQKMLIKEPARYISLINTVCNIANSGLRFDKYRRALASTPDPGSAGIPAGHSGSSQIKENQG
jgi:hypothetical protein